MTIANVFWGALLALSVYELIHLSTKEVVIYIQRKKAKKRWDSLIAKLDESGWADTFDCDDDCDVCNEEDGEPVTIKRITNKPVKKTVKKAVAKKKTVKKAAPKKRK